MHATDLIKQLEDLVKKHGDHEVVDEYGNEMDPVEFDDEYFVVGFSE